MTGADIKSAHWDAFYKFYLNTTGETCLLPSSDLAPIPLSKNINPKPILSGMVLFGICSPQQQHSARGRSKLARWQKRAGLLRYCIRWDLPRSQFAATDGHIDVGYADKKWGQAYLTREFFQVLGETMPEQVLLVMAEDGSGRPVAGALNLIGSHALFGRNWGCAGDTDIKHLHFEVCYYQARALPLPWPPSSSLSRRRSIASQAPCMLASPTAVCCAFESKNVLANVLHHGYIFCMPHRAGYVCFHPPSGI